MLSFLFWTTAGALYLVQGQVSVHIHENGEMYQHPVFQNIDSEYKRGLISRESALLQKFRYAYNSANVDTDYLSKRDTPVKCLVPLLAEYTILKEHLTVSAIQEIEKLTEAPNTDHLQSHISDSGNFIFYFETEGSNAVPETDTNNNEIPDYVEAAAFAADSSYRYQVETAGFPDFKKSEPYEIYFQNFGFYGTTTASGSTTFIRLHNNFEGFPPNGHPKGDVTGAMYATIAHEVKHAIQYETNRWEGDAGSFDWIEMDATMMEEVIFPDVNDYYNYIKADYNSTSPSSQSIFGTPGNATPGAYWHITWMLYFYEEYGIDFWVDVWDQFIEERTKPFFQAIQATLSNKGLNIGIEHLKNHKWHMASGPDNFIANFGFVDGDSYPNPNFFTEILNLIPDEIEAFELHPYAANYILATPPVFTEGQPRFSLQSTHSGVGIGLIGYFHDGSTRQELRLDPNSTIQSMQTTWNWNDLDRISIAVVNTNTSQTANYRLEMTSTTPDEDFIAQNYPNPFNPATRITFSINENKHIRLDIFDSIGRRVTTLLDQQLESGYHTVNFDGTGLSSGIYFYRIVTDELSTSKKMILIK